MIAKNSVQFIRSLKKDFETNKNDWENDSLSSFLEAMAAWIEDMDGYYTNTGQPFQEKPSWKTIGEILMAARQ